MPVMLPLWTTARATSGEAIVLEAAIFIKLIDITNGSVIDRHGNAVALTSTVNTYFGSKGIS